MKVQCSCGAPYEFDVTPDMAQGPVQFVCPACGGDLSESLTNLFRQEVARNALPTAAIAQEVQSPVSKVGIPQPPAQPLRLHAPEHSQPATAPETTSEPVAEEQRCPRHPAELATDKCYMCSKPICPKCMEVFGYLCSPLCKAKANSHGIDVPVYEGQKSLVEARLWRKTVGVAAGVGAVIVLLIGVWCFYVFYGSTPKIAFSTRFGTVAYSGQSLFAGKDQIVFLHGETVARYDMAQKKEIWSRQLVDKKEIEKKADMRIKEIQIIIDRANSEAWEHVPKMPSREKLIQRMEKAAAAALELHIRGESVWVASPEKLMRFDWSTGKILQEVPIPERYGGVIAVGDELLLMETGDGKQIATHINLTNCDWRTEEIGKLGPPTLVASGKGSASAGADGAPGGPELAGLPVGMPGKDSDKPMDPKRVAEQAQRLSYPAKLALPAVLSNARNQERTMRELDEQKRSSPTPAPGRDPAEDFSIIPTKDGFVQVAVKEVEHKILTREAMKAPPAKSVLAGEVNVTQSAEVANEILNEMQRERGGGVIMEDRSRFRVKLLAPNGKEGWTGEVMGYPTVYPLQTVTVLSAGKLIQVFDKANKKLWESKLNFNMEGGLGALEQDKAPYGMGPCVERKDTLYVIDEGVLTAFDLANGNVRWRYPSVGIAGIFFDEKGMMYVNTTTASPDNIRYPRQINISRKDIAVVLKLDPKDGKVLWTAEPGGLVNYVSGKYLYTVQMYSPYEDDDEDDPYNEGMQSKVPPYVRIKRINPRNGHVMWEHFQQRAPVDIEFDKNTIRLVFKKEVQVLKFFSL